jgi:hypothetical protein
MCVFGDISMVIMPASFWQESYRNVKSCTSFVNRRYETTKEEEDEEVHSERTKQTSREQPDIQKSV